MTSARTVGPVRIVGTGLLGASIGLALRQLGIDVILGDVSPAAIRLAIDYGAGRAAQHGDEPALIVVAVPPDVVATVVAAELAAHPLAIVTDVASVKLAPLTELRSLGVELDRYIGSHPMAGRERGGAIAARADLFIGQPWIIAANGSAAAFTAVENLALDLHATPVELDVAEHDRTVALISHVPQVVASLLAARLSEASDVGIGLAGPGVRDTTRIASANPELWVQILSANAGPVVDILRRYRDDLDAVIASLADHDADGARRTIAGMLAAGNSGVSRIPGKHGQRGGFASITVVIDDKPGELARLLTEIGDAGVNMEDLHLEHSPGAQVGFAEVSVLPEVEQALVDQLTADGWKIPGASV